MKYQRVRKKSQHPTTLGVLAQTLDCTFVGDADIALSGVGTIENATTSEVAFLENPKYQRYLENCQASVVIVTPKVAESLTQDVAHIISDNPKLIFSRCIQVLYPQAKHQALRHPSAVIDESAEIAEDVYIGPNVSIGKHVRIGAGVYLGPSAVVEDGVSIGMHSKVHAQVTLCHDVVIGEHCEIHSGTVIGSDGFGFANDQGKWEKVPQIGSVIIGDHVEIGANNTIDRGAIDDTIIEDGVILDNLIQIAHNVRIRSFTAIASCVGIAGSADIGRYCLIGGGSRINGHISITDGVHLIAGSMVGNTISNAGVYASALPVRPRESWVRNIARFGNLDELAKRVKKIEKKIEVLHQEDT